MYRITDEELEGLVVMREDRAHDTEMFTFCGGIFISFAIVLLTSPPTSRSTLDIFFILAVLGGILAFYFWRKMRAARRRETNMLRRIRERGA